MKSGDITYMDESIQPLAESIQKCGWIRIITACGGHVSGGANIESTNLFDMEIDVSDTNKFQSLKRAIDKRFNGVVWSGAMANDRIQYRFANKKERNSFIFILKKAFDILAE